MASTPLLTGVKACIICLVLNDYNSIKVQSSQRHQMGACWATKMVLYRRYFRKYSPKSHRHCSGKYSSCNHCSSLKWEPAGLPRWYFIDVLENIHPRATDIVLTSTTLAGVKVLCLVLNDNNPIKVQSLQRHQIRAYWATKMVFCRYLKKYSP